MTAEANTPSTQAADTQGRKASLPDEATLHDLIGLIYEAAVEPGRWPGFLEAFSETLDPANQDYHRLLLPHLRRAREMQQRLAQRSLGRRGALEALDSLAGGVMVLDGAGHVCYANREAEKLLACGRGLRRDEAGAVRALLQWQNQKLYRLIAQAAAGERDIESRGCLRVSRAQGQPLTLLVAPLAEEGANPGAAKCGALVFIHDPDATPALLAETVRWHFELTPAQARLAAALAAGDSVTDCATSLGVSVATVRTHLKEIFAKTGARRQSDLVRLLLSNSLFHARGNGAPEEASGAVRRADAEIHFLSEARFDVP